MTVLAPVRRVLPAGPSHESPTRRRAAIGAALGVVSLGVIALVIALLLAGGGPQPAPAGLPSAGLVTGWALRGARLVADVLALVTIGLLLTGAVLVPDTTSGRRAVRSTGTWALAWAGSLAALLLLTVSDIAGVPMEELDTSTLREMAGTSRVHGLAASAVAVALVAAVSVRVRTVRGARLLLAVSLLGTIPAYATGHATTAPDPSIAVAGVAVHVVAALLWTGGLVALVWPLRRDPALATAVSRYSALALGCYLALAMSGLVTAAARLGTSPQAWASGYGALVLAKLTLLAGLGLLGHRHRRRTLPLLAAGRRGAFLRLAALEVSVMGIALGLAAALGSTPPTRPGGSGGGHAAMTTSPLPFPVEPYAWWRLLTEWRPDAAVLVGVGALGALGLRRTPHRARLVAGLAVVVVATCSGISAYAPSVLGAQVAQLLLVLLVAPALIVPAFPRLTVLVRVPPVAAAVLASSLLLGLYRTPLLEMSLRSSWVALGLLLVAALAGVALVLTVLDPDAPVGDRLVAGLPVAGSLGLLAAQLAATDRLVASGWFLSVRPNGDLPAAQLVAAVLCGLAALAVLTAVALGRASAQSGSGQSRTTTRPSSADSATAP